MTAFHPSQSAEQTFGKHPALRACVADTVSRDRQIRVAVAGSITSATDEETVETEETLMALSQFGDLELEHLALGAVEKGYGSLACWRQFSGLVKAAVGLVKMRWRGPMNILLYPAAGSKAENLIRDILLLPACLLAARRVIIVFHSEGIELALARFNPALRRMVRMLYRSCSAIVVTEHGLREPEILGMNDRSVIYKGLRDTLEANALKRRTPDDRPSLLYCGKLSPETGTPALLQAVSRVIEIHPGARLTLIGAPTPTYTEAELQQDIRRLGLQEKVIWRGPLEGSEKWEVFASANLFAYPSVSPSESCSRSILEAMCWRLPIVTTRWRALPEITFGTAWYADPRRGLADSLTESLLTAIEENQTWFRKGQACRMHYEENFTRGKWATALHRAILISINR